MKAVCAAKSPIDIKILRSGSKAQDKGGSQKPRVPMGSSCSSGLLGPGDFHTSPVRLLSRCKEGLPPGSYKEYYNQLGLIAGVPMCYTAGDNDDNLSPEEAKERKIMRLLLKAPRAVPCDSGTYRGPQEPGPPTCPS